MSRSSVSPRLSNTELAPATYRRLAELFRAYAGMLLDDDLLPKLERRLQARLFAVGVESFDEYYKHLKYRDPDKREIRAATELLTVHETYFFREQNQLNLFRQQILPQLHNQKKDSSRRAIKIWCAGCSSGEEVYTISMLVRASRLFDSWEVQIIGTDISQGVLSIAEEAIYSEASFRAMPREYFSFFDPVGSDRFRVRDRYRRICQFARHNLVCPEDKPFMQNVDVILCRNVLIYFPVEIRQQVVRLFHQTLRPGGFLLLGHSESLLNTSESFQVASFQDALVYKRPDTSSLSLRSRVRERKGSGNW